MIILSFLFMFSCNNNIEKKTIKDNFPLIILDSNASSFYEGKSFNNYDYYYYLFGYFYIGKYKDKIHLIDFYPLYIDLPPIPFEKGQPDPNLQVKPQLIPEKHVHGYMENYPFKMPEESDMNILIDTSQKIFDHYPVILKNTSKDTIQTGNGEILNIGIEKFSDSTWHYYKEPFIRTCANNIGAVILLPGEIILTFLPVNFIKQKFPIRLRFGKNYSRIINVSDKH